MVKKPLVSILIPTYNSELTIVQCINSVMHQSYDNIELLVCDGHSTDKTIELIKCFFPDSVVLFESRPGVSRQRNVLLKNAKGNLLFFLDSDDYLDCRCISYLVDAQLGSNADIVAPSYVFFNDEATVRRIYEDKKLIYNIESLTGKGIFPSPHKLYKKNFLDNTIFKNNYSFGEDFIFNYELAKKSGYILLSSTAIYYYRKSSDFLKYGPFRNIKLLQFQYRQKKWVAKNTDLKTYYDNYLCKLTDNMISSCIFSRRILPLLFFLNVRLYCSTHNKNKAFYFLFPIFYKVLNKLSLMK